jgi:cellulose synthase (UDP-forming)
MAILTVAVVVGLERSWTPATLNNVSFALLHLIVLGTGVAPALRRRSGTASTQAAVEELEAA